MSYEEFARQFTTTVITGLIENPVGDDLMNDKNERIDNPVA